MKDVKGYDGDLQMFAESTTPVSLAYLRFLRWMIDEGRLEHLPAGPPSGPLLDGLPEAAQADAA